MIGFHLECYTLFMGETEPPLREGERESVISRLFKKLSVAKGTQGNSSAAQREVERQIGQVSRDNTLTKSGGED